MFTISITLSSLSRFLWVSTFPHTRGSFPTLSNRLIQCVVRLAVATSQLEFLRVQKNWPFRETHGVGLFIRTMRRLTKDHRHYVTLFVAWIYAIKRQICVVSSFWFRGCRGQKYCLPRDGGVEFLTPVFICYNCFVCSLNSNPVSVIESSCLRTEMINLKSRIIFWCTFKYERLCKFLM